MAGEPLLRGVSFKLERRDRLTLSGRNGSGKTTLLRMLSGETGIDGGELVFAKGVRVSLHDQRPPRDRDLSPARLRALGLQGAARARGGAVVARGQDGRGRDGRRDLQRLLDRPDAARARRWLQLAPRRSTRPCTASGSATSTSIARWRRSPAASSPARPSPGRSRAIPTSCCSTSRPTTSTSPRSSGSRRTCRRSTPRSSWWPTIAGSSRRSARPSSSSRAARRSTSRAPGAPGGSRRPSASWRLGA